MSQLNIDFETASQVDLITEGVYKYAQDPTTEVMMAYWAFDDEEPSGWFPGDEFPERIWKHVTNGGRIDAANAAFERLIWWYVMKPKHNWSDPALEQFYCTLYKARANNLPASLDKLARALGTFNQKQAAAGKALIKKFCILDENGYSLADGDEDQDAVDSEFNNFCDYCAQDVRAERGAGKMMREPTEEEWQDYWISERINDRGVKIDYDLAEQATTYAEEEKLELEGQIQELTGGEIVKARGEKLKAWVMERLTEDQQRPMVRYKTVDGKKTKKYSLDKSAREELLEQELDPIVAEVIQASDFAQKSSVSKFKAMCLRADPQTDRVCGAFMANGASGTGRYSSKGLQVHNFARNGMEDPSEVRTDLVENIDPGYLREHYDMPIMTMLSRMLRAAIVPGKGNVLLVSDWSAIEGRIAPWLTCTRSGERKLDQYRNNEPVYEWAAVATFHCALEDVTPDQRQIGKVEELSFQFGGGSNAFLGMARNYGIRAGKEEAEEFKNAWREANPWAPEMWKRLETAVFEAVRSPGHQIVVGKVNYFAVPDILGVDMTLFCQLPCGRVLTYPDIRIGQKKAPWGDMVPSLSAMRPGWTPKAGDKKWPRGGVYGGLLFENIVQGTAASLLRDALAVCDAEGLPVVLHVHDEIVLDVPSGDSNVATYSSILYDVMNSVPDWAEGLPIQADVVEMDRYGK